MPTRARADHTNAPPAPVEVTAELRFAPPPAPPSAPAAGGGALGLLWAEARAAQGLASEPPAGGDGVGGAAGAAAGEAPWFPDRAASHHVYAAESGRVRVSLDARGWRYRWTLARSASPADARPPPPWPESPPYLLAELAALAAGLPERPAVERCEAGLVYLLAGAGEGRFDGTRPPPPHRVFGPLAALAGRGTDGGTGGAATLEAAAARAVYAFVGEDGARGRLSVAAAPASGEDPTARAAGGVTAAALLLAVEGRPAAPTLDGARRFLLSADAALRRMAAAAAAAPAAQGL